MPSSSPNVFFAIVRGVPKAPQDSLSAEIGLDNINLLDTSGFMVDTYDIQIPNLKSSAIWADNPTTDGRTLISAAQGNLTESIRLTLTAGSLIQLSAQLVKLGKFREYASNFWTGGTQDTAEPVYIKHQIEGEPGPRYALLYNIEIHVDTPIDPGELSREITLSIEREPYWRGLAPGDNPKRWTIEKVMTGQKWDATKAALYTSNDHLVFQQIDNCQEFLTNTSFQSVNFVDIPAASIPGDAPPLLCLLVNTTGVNGVRHYIGVSTNRTSITDRFASAALLLYNSIPMSAGTLASGTAVFTTDTARGIAHVPTSALKRTVVVTPAGATEVTVVTWTAATNLPHMSQHILKGKYALFLRASQIGGTANTVTARITMSDSGGGVFDSGLLPVADDTATGSEINYFGVVEFPLTTRSMVSVDGKGYTVETDINQISLSTMRSAGAGTIRLIDMFLMPLGNYMYFNHPVNNGVLPFDVYDDTGYFAHGYTDPVITARTFQSAADFVYPVEATGRLQLTPGVNNRLYFVEYQSSVGAQANLDMTVRANIVPRWSGYRDV